LTGNTDEQKDDLDFELQSEFIGNESVMDPTVGCDAKFKEKTVKKSKRRGKKPRPKWKLSKGERRQKRLGRRIKRNTSDKKVSMPVTRIKVFRRC